MLIINKMFRWLSSGQLPIDTASNNDLATTAADDDTDDGRLIDRDESVKFAGVYIGCRYDNKLIAPIAL